jgi:Ala-tRNA(Pro) deacylase
MRGQKELYDLLAKLSIKFDYHEHPPVNTIDDAITCWKDFNSGRCKNIFFRNHKGNRHYLVILEHLNQLNIHDLEKRLKQGKLTFASDHRLKKYLGVEPGSVSPFGLINDFCTQAASTPPSVHIYSYKPTLSLFSVFQAPAVH